MMPDAPQTLTYLFTDLEGSTRLWEEFPYAMQDALARHDEILHDAIGLAAGTVVKGTGDGLMAVFASPAEAVTAAATIQRAMAAGPWPATGPLRVRIGVHRGESQPRAGDFYGTAVNRAARIMSAANGGQTLLSESVVVEVREQLAEDWTLRDLGEHRLKDLAAPERLHQLDIHGLTAAFPPLATLDRRPNNLPTQTSVFLGRERELESLGSLIATTGVRLVTLLGPGGIGKTRLALQVAADQLDGFADGLFFASLAEARTPEVAFAAIARALGIASGSDASPLDIVKMGIGSRQLLVLLDNLEQVTDVSRDLAELLGACPNLSLLVTSRQALRVRGERIFPVEPLSVPAAAVPTLTEVLDSEAGRLFVERAIEVKPDFAIEDADAPVIAEICRRLDGLPLAIELAVARLRVFSPQGLLERLERRLDVLKGGARDLPERQQTIRAALEWSHEMLSPEECQLFEALGVFAGARFDAIEATLEGIVDTDLVDCLESLVNQSLVRAIDDGEPRFTMLGTIRDFAIEKLAEDADREAAVRHAHASHFKDMAAGLRPHLGGKDRASTLKTLGRELDNLGAAWHWYVEAADLKTLQEFLDTLWALYDARGWYRGVVVLAEDLIGLLEMGDQTAERARERMALQTSVARALMTMNGYTAEVEAAFDRALAIADDSGHAPERFPVLRSLASLYSLRSEFTRSFAVAKELLIIAEASDDQMLIVEANLVAGVTVAFTDNPLEGAAMVEQAAELFNHHEMKVERFRLGPNPGVQTLTTAAILLWGVGFPERAFARAAQAERVSADLEHPASRAYALHHVNLLYATAGRFDLVGDRCAELLALANTNDFPIWRAMAIFMGGLATTAGGDPAVGLTEMQRGLDLYRLETTPPVFWPFLLMLHAVGHAMAGRTEEGLTLIDDAISHLRPGDLQGIDFHLVRADLLVAAGRAEEALATFVDVLDRAGEAGIRMAELTAATRLTQLAEGTQGHGPARDRLASVLASFTEDSDAMPIVAARSLLG